jgi:predicted amidohydrolase
MTRLLQSCCCLALAAAAGLFFQGGSSSTPGDVNAANGWQPMAPREEIKPRFSFDAKGGPKNAGSLVVAADRREGQHGWWQKSFPITGGKTYRFHAVRRVHSVEVPRRSAMVRILWRDEKGRAVRADPPDGDGQAKGYLPTAEPEYPVDRKEQEWTEVEGTYRAPAQATKAIVELHLRWAPGGRIDWSEAGLTEAPPPKSRKVRLAAVHFTPRGGKSPMDNCRMFATHIAEAARQKADLVVLGETITYVGLGKTFAEVAEPIPGPATEYFCALAKKHRIYIVVGLVERDGNLIYNVAVLIGPDGRILGKYRKVCLPRGEVDGGLTPGRDYPVFDTPLGKIGMMVCYDGFFPEVARELSKRGAEVIAWPVWGCNPLLAGARACENHVHLVSSTYTDIKSNWTLTAVYDHDGKPIVRAEKWGTVIVAEVDLGRRFFWRNNLGDFRAEIIRSRPIAQPERRR